MWEHWAAAAEADHPARMATILEPGLKATFEVYTAWWPQLNEIRAAVVSELADMIQDWEDTTTLWFEGLHPDLQAVYTTNGTKAVTQVPVLIELLRWAGYQGVEVLQEELTVGFEMTGRLNPGTGWLPRTYGRYRNPISMQSFHDLNKAYVQEKLVSANPSEHWQVLLEELMSERAASSTGWLGNALQRS